MAKLFSLCMLFSVAVGPLQARAYPTEIVRTSNKRTSVEDTVVYFFALTPGPAPPTYATWTNATITHFVSECPEVAATVVYGRATGVNPSVLATYQKHVSTIKQIAFWHFDDVGAVLKFDAWIPTLQQWWNTTHDVPDYSVNEALVRQQLCQTTQAKKPTGTFDNLWGDNFWCRALHVRLTQLRPDVHCDHVGPRGGGKCVNAPYNEAYFDDEAVFDEPTREVSSCPGIYIQASGE